MCMYYNLGHKTALGRARASGDVADIDEIREVEIGERWSISWRIRYVRLRSRVADVMNDTGMGKSMGGSGGRERVPVDDAGRSKELCIEPWGPRESRSRRMDRDA